MHVCLCVLVYNGHVCMCMCICVTGDQRSTSIVVLPGHVYEELS